MQWIEENEVVEEQAGFRPERGCVDQLYVFGEVVNKRIAEDKATYLAFIDVRKAYDRVWRKGLWKRVWDAGVQGRMWRMLRAMYEKAQSCVMVEGEMSDWFKSEIGVRQGCVLSPVLYSIFINGFAKALKNGGVGGVEVGEEKLKLLLFADDIVMFAESEEELQEMLGGLEEYCYKWRFEVNTKKSQVMICGEGEVKNGWWFNGKELEVVDKYKYLGLIVTADGKWEENAKRLSEKGRSKSNKMHWWLSGQEKISVGAKYEVWKALVASGMRYGSEVWWNDKCQQKYFEATQNMAIKKMLGCSKATTTEFVRGEVAALELRRNTDIAKLVWYGRLVLMDKKRWAKKVFNIEWKWPGTRKMNWRRKVESLIKEYRMEEERERLVNRKMSLNEWKETVKRMVEEEAIDEWEQSVKSHRKLELYSKIKQKWGREEYTRGPTDKGSKVMAKLRSGTCLNQERSRWGIDENGESRSGECVVWGRGSGNSGTCADGV